MLMMRLLSGENYRRVLMTPRTGETLHRVTATTAKQHYNGKATQPQRHGKPTHFILLQNVRGNHCRETFRPGRALFRALDGTAHDRPVENNEKLEQTDCQKSQQLQLPSTRTRGCPRQTQKTYRSTRHCSGCFSSKETCLFVLPDSSSLIVVV